MTNFYFNYYVNITAFLHITISVIYLHTNFVYELSEKKQFHLKIIILSLNILTNKFNSFEILTDDNKAVIIVYNKSICNSILFIFCVSISV